MLRCAHCKSSAVAYQIVSQGVCCEWYSCESPICFMKLVDNGIKYDTCGVAEVCRIDGEEEKIQEKLA